MASPVARSCREVTPHRPVRQSNRRAPPSAPDGGATGAVLCAQRADVLRPEPAAAADDPDAALDPSAHVAGELARREALVELPVRRGKPPDVRVDADGAVPAR